MLVTTLSAQVVLAVFALVYAASVFAAIVAVRDPQASPGLKAAWATALLLLPPVGLVAWEAARVADHRAAHRPVTVVDRAAHVASGSARV